MSDAAVTLTGGKHGTKWIGALTTATAIISGLDPTLLPPSWLPYVAGVAGVLTVIRGVVNSARTPPEVIRN